MKLRTCFILVIFQSLVLAQNVPLESWSGQCAAILQPFLNETAHNISIPSDIVFVGSNGDPIQQVTNKGDVWGVQYNTCTTRCGHVSSPFNFSEFATALLTWFLPWAALTAQLPYETAGTLSDLRNGLLAVGSPCLVMYSLIITISTRNRLADDFKGLFKAARTIWISRAHPRLLTQLGHVLFVLQESQQAPMRAYEGSGWLTSLVCLVVNNEWWDLVHKSLKSTRRGITQSLILQMIAAMISWVFTIIIAFESVGSADTALSLASSSVWIWLVTVIIGWVRVGTQGSATSIESALEHLGRRAVDSPDEDTDLKPKTGSQDGILARSGINPQFDPPAPPDRRPSRIPQLARSRASYGVEMRPLTFRTRTLSSNQESVSTQMTYTKAEPLVEARPIPSPGPSRSSAELPLPNVEQPEEEEPLAEELGLDVTTAQLLATEQIDPDKTIPTCGSFELTGDEAEAGPLNNHARVFTHDRFSKTIIYAHLQLLHKLEQQQTPGRADWNIQATINEHMRGTRADLYYYIDLLPHMHEAYPRWKEIDPRIWRSMFLAALWAIFLQWGTTGPSILLGYSTPTAGLGCRSGSYLLYAVISTVSWLLVVTASLLSHAVMLRYQEKGKTPQVLSYLSLGVRFVGKRLGEANAIWLVISTCLELTGVYDNCWCNTDYLSLRSKGYIVIFKDVTQLEPVVNKVWLGSTLFVSLVCLISMFFVSVTPRGNPSLSR